MCYVEPELPKVLVFIEAEPERILINVSIAAWREQRSEWGGLLYGRSYQWRTTRIVVVSAAIPALGSGTEVSFEFDPQSYVLAQRLVWRNHGTELVDVGLWHSHPHLDVTPSWTDREYLALLYPQAGSIGVIVNPFAPAVAAYATAEDGVVSVPAYSIGSAKGDAPDRDQLIRAWDLDEVRRALA